MGQTISGSADISFRRVILSGGSASLQEADAQSKDPYLALRTVAPMEISSSKSASPGYLQIIGSFDSASIRERMEKISLRMTMTGLLLKIRCGTISAR